MLLYSGLSSFGQESKLTTTYSFGFLGLDDDIYGSTRTSASAFNGYLPSSFPSLYFDVGIDYKWFILGNFSMNSGVKYGAEWNKPQRGFNHCQFVVGPLCPYVNVITNGYA